MERVIFVTLLMLFFLMTVRASELKIPQNIRKKNENSANEILKHVAEKLSSLKTLKYNYQREVNYLSEGYHQELEAESFLDFTLPDKTLGLRYQFKNKDYLTIYNGSEKFSCNLNKKTIEVVNNPTQDSFNGTSFFYNSPITLRNALPSITADDEIPKLLLNDDKKQNVYEVEFTVVSKTLDGLGNLSPITLERKIIYRLTIDKTTFLPLQVLQKNNVNEDYTKTVFSNLKMNSPLDAPTELSWYYSSYLKEFKRDESSGVIIPMIKPGEIAPNWNLPQFETGKSASLDDFAGKMIMLEFWISHCGYCISAVPHLNALTAKYQNKDFKFFAINAHDSAEIIHLFKKSYKPVYEILLAGEKIAKLYGAINFPTVVLIDKNGKIIYAGVFNENTLDELISKNL